MNASSFKDDYLQTHSYCGQSKEGAWPSGCEGRHSDTEKISRNSESVEFNTLTCGLAQLITWHTTSSIKALHHLWRLRNSCSMSQESIHACDPNAPPPDTPTPRWCPRPAVNTAASYRIIQPRTFLQPWTEWKSPHLGSKSQPTIMKKCMLLQVYDRHGRSWSRNSGVVYHLPTSNANHRWRFADSGFPGSKASHLILSSSFFQIPNLQTSPVLFPLLRLLVEAPPVLRHSRAVRAVVAICVWSLCWHVMKISIIWYNWLYIDSFDLQIIATLSIKEKSLHETNIKNLEGVWGPSI